MRVLGRWVGPVVLAAGVWAAAGTVAPVGVESASHRMAVPASPLWFLGALVAASCLAPLRRHPRLASPALLPCLVWLPLPTPNVAFIWTGVFAWLPVVLSLAAVGLTGRLQPASGPPVPARGAMRTALFAGALTIALGATVWVSFGPRLPSGDEPHYLVIAQSLLLDGDVQIENNHRARDYASFADGDLAPHSLRRGTNGALYSIHAPGLPLVVAPLFAVAGYRGAWATVLGFAGLAGALIWWIGWETCRDEAAAWFAWAAMTTSVAFLALAPQVFPDVPGAAAVALGVAASLALARGRTLAPAALVATSAALSLLPFLHTRFVVIAAGLGATIGWQLVRPAGVTAEVRWRRTAWFLAVPVTAAFAWFGYFYVLYGTPVPSAPYGPTPEIQLRYIPGGMAGLFFDQQFGLLAYAPVLALAVFGCRRVSRPLVLPAHAHVATFVAYAAAVSSYWMWWAGGPATPARLLVAALPLAAAPLAVAWSSASPFRRSLFVVLLGFSVAMSIACLLVRGGELAWNTRGTEASWIAAVGAAANLARLWPSFFWGLVPGVVGSELGFFIHVACWLGALMGMAWGLGAWVRAGGEANSRWRTGLAAAWWLPLSLSLLGTLAPWLTGSRPLEPATSQLEVLARVAAGSRALEIRPLGLRSLTEAVPPIRVAVREISWTEDASSEPFVTSLPGVPAGRYQFVVRAQRPLGGTLTLDGGTRSERRMALEPRTEQRVDWTTTEDAATVTMTFDAVMIRSRASVELVPVSLAARGQ